MENNAIMGVTAYNSTGGKLPFGMGSNMAGYSCVKDPRVHGNVGTKIDIDQPPDRYELFLLGDGEKKVEFEPETRKLRAQTALSNDMPANNPHQASRTQPCSPSTRKTTPLATCYARS